MCFTKKMGGARSCPLLLLVWVTLHNPSPLLAQCLIGKYGDPSGGISRFYSYRIALSGDRALVSGSPTGIYAYERAGPNWVATGTMPAPGFEPALDGNRAMIGDWGYGGEIGYGLVTVLEHDGSEWKAVAELEPLDKYDGNWFGWSVALSGDTAVIGAVRYDTGKAYVFERDRTGAWKQTAKLKPSTPGTSEHFGWALATDGERIVAGAIFDWSQGFTTGATYVFERGTNGSWVQSQKLYPPDQKSYYYFGESVAISGGSLFVGATGSEASGQPAGAVYEYHLTPEGTWQLETSIVAEDAANSDVFGRSIAFAGDLLLVGAPGSDSKGQSSGSTYVFFKEAAAWKQIAKLVPTDSKQWDNFGTSVAMSGNIGLIGMWQQKPDPPWEPGFARFYAVGPDLNGNGLMDPCECPGDLDKDWTVGQKDLALLLAYWGKCTGQPGFKPEYDLDQSGCIDQGDLGLILSNYGNICP